MKIVRLVLLSVALALISFAAQAQGKPAAEGCLSIFRLAAERHDDQGSILVPFRPAQHGRDPCRR